MLRLFSHQVLIRVPFELKAAYVLLSGPDRAPDLQQLATEVAFRFTGKTPVRFGKPTGEENNLTCNESEFEALESTHNQTTKI